MQRTLAKCRCVHRCLCDALLVIIVFVVFVVVVVAAAVIVAMLVIICDHHHVIVRLRALGASLSHAHLVCTRTRCAFDHMTASQQDGAAKTKAKARNKDAGKKRQDSCACSPCAALVRTPCFPWDAWVVRRKVAVF